MDDKDFDFDSEVSLDPLDKHYEALLKELPFYPTNTPAMQRGLLDCHPFRLSSTDPSNHKKGLEYYAVSIDDIARLTNSNVLLTEDKIDRDSAITEILVQFSEWFSNNVATLLHEEGKPQIFANDGERYYSLNPFGKVEGVGHVAFIPGDLLRAKGLLPEESKDKWIEPKQAIQPVIGDATARLANKDNSDKGKSPSQ